MRFNIKIIVLSVLFCLVVVGTFCLIKYSKHNIDSNLLESNSSNYEVMSDKEIINTFVDNFMLVAKVPRPSHHEEKISNFFMDWAKEQGLNPKKDSLNNVMFDVPATKGMEKKPLGVLQVHMDMVVAVEDGRNFDPLSEPITVIRNDDEGILRADGTSLGADDGAGLSIVMAIVQGKMQHGPLRIIITVNEEDGMEGARNVDKSWLKDCEYLINIDNEAADEVLVSTASGDCNSINKEISYVNPTGDLAINIGLFNLKGGHSGVEIDKGRLNGIIALGNFMKQLDEDGIYYELSSFEGGTAANAIPTKASAVLVIKAEDKDKIKQRIANYCDILNEKYKDIEDDIRYEVTEKDELPQVVSKEEKNNMIKYITEVIDGVYTWSKDIDGLVESSSNLGIARLNKDGLSITIMFRSSSPKKETEIGDAQMELAKLCDYKVNIIKTADAWDYDPDSDLLELTKKVYKEQNGEEIKVVAVHAGVECGTFKTLKPDLDMVSIGPDLKDVHTINETLYLNSVPKIWHLLQGILEKI